MVLSGVVNTVLDPELEIGGSVIQTLIFRPVGHQYGLKITPPPPGPSPGSTTSIITGQITMAMRIVYVEYCKLPLVSSPTFKPFPPLMSPSTQQKSTSDTEIQTRDPCCF